MPDAGVAAPPVAPNTPPIAPNAPGAPTADPIIGQMQKETDDQKSALAANEAARTAAEASDMAAANSLSDKLSKQAEEPVKTPPMPENAAKHLDPKELMSTAQAFMVAGSLFGLLSRQPLTAAMNNMTAAMKGVQEADGEQYDKAMNEFKVNFDKTMKLNDELIKAKQDALNDTKLSLTARMEKLRLIDAKYDNAGKYLEQSFNKQMQMFDAQMKARDTMLLREQNLLLRHQEMQLRREQMAQAERHFQLTREGGGAGSPESMQVSAFKYLMLGKEPPGMGNASAEQRKQVRNEASKLGASLGLSPMEQAMLPVNNAMKIKAADALTKWGAFVDKSANNIANDLKLVINAAKKVDPGSIQTINKAVLAGKTEFQDGPSMAYALAVNKLNTEYIRLQQGPLSNAMLHVDAAKKSDELLGKAISAEAWETDIAPMILSEAANTKKATTQTRDALMAEVTAPSGGYSGNGNQGAAPTAAVAHLKAHPELAEQFKAKYGYLPQ